MSLAPVQILPVASTPFAVTIWRTGQGLWAITATGAGTDCSASAATIEQAVRKLSDDLQYIVLRRASQLVALEAGSEND